MLNLFSYLNLKLVSVATVIGKYVWETCGHFMLATNHIGQIYTDIMKFRVLFQHQIPKHTCHHKVAENDKFGP